MSIEVNEIQRRFRYNGMLLPDVPGLEPREVRDLYSAQYPELVSAEIEPGEVHDGVQEFSFRKAVGTKGTTRRAGKRLSALSAQVDAQARGDVCGPEGKLINAMSRKPVKQCAQVWSVLAHRTDARSSDEREASRIVLPSDALAPLP